MSKQKFCIYFLSLIIFTSSAFSQDNSLNSVLDYIKQNKYKEAITNLVNVYKYSANKEEALSWMLLLKDYSNNLDNLDEYLKDCLEVYQDPNPFFFAHWSSQLLMGREFKFNKEIPNLYDDLLDSKKLNTTIRAFAYEHLSKYYAFKDKYDDYLESLNKLGGLSKWSVVGVFENVSESGFDKNYEPITKPNTDAVFTNKIGAKVTWKTLADYVSGKWINLAFHYDIYNSIGFAQCFVESPDDRTVEVRIGTSGSLKFWVNDELIMQEAEERNNGMDTYIARLPLKKGNNRFLIQLGSSEIDNMNFFCRIMDLNGNIANDLQYSADYKPYPKAENSKIEIVKNFAEEYFLNKIKDDPSKLLNYLLLAKCYLGQDKNSLAIEYAKKADSIMPNNALIQSIMLNTYYRDDNRTMQSQVQESIRTLDPTSIMALNSEFGELAEAQKYDELGKVVAKYEQYVADQELVGEKRMITALYLNQIEKAFGMLTKLHDQYPHNLSFTVLLYRFSLNIQSKEFDPEDILLQYYDKGKSQQIISALFDYYVSKNKYDEAIDLYQDFMLKFYPESALYHHRIGDINFSAMRYDKAIKNYQIALEKAPYISYIHSSLGRAYSENSKKDLASASFAKAIEYNPQNYFARNEMRKLFDKKALIDIVPTPDIQKIVASAPGIAQYPEDNSIILLDESVRVAYSGGGSENKTYFAVKVLNKAGIDNWKEYRLPITNSVDGVIEKAEIIKKDGKRQKAEVDDAYAVFTNLEPEDVIWMIYSTKNYQPGTLINQFTDDISFTFSIPVMKVKYTLITEKGVKFNKVQLNSDITPTTENTADYDLISWEKSNIKAIKYEQFMPPYNDIAERVFISTIPDWDFVSKWYANISKGKAKDDRDVQITFNSIFPKGYKDLSEQERASRIYEYVVKEIRYSSVPFRQSGLVPQKASKTIVTRIGDCKDVSTLFSTLCQKAELRSGIVLIELNDNGNKSMPLPSTSFEHAIGYVYIDGQKKYVELTSDLLPFATISGGLKNGNALEISNDLTIKNDLFHLNPPNHTPNLVIRKTKVNFENDKMFVNKQSTKIGGPAAGMRKSYRDIANEQRFKKMESIISSDYPKVKLLKFECQPNLSTLADSVDYVYQYRVDDVFTPIAGLNILKLPWADAITNNEIIAQSDRKFGVDLDYLVNEDECSELLEVEIPINQQIAEVPTNVEQSGKYFDYKLSYLLEGNKLTCKRSFIKKLSLISLEDYPEFVKQLQTVIKADANQVAFKAVK